MPKSPYSQGEHPDERRGNERAPQFRALNIISASQIGQKLAKAINHEACGDVEISLSQKRIFGLFGHRSEVSEKEEAGRKLSASALARITGAEKVLNSFFCNDDKQIYNAILNCVL